MRKLLIISLLIVICIGCQTTENQQIEVSSAKIEPVPIPKEEIPELTKEQINQLDKRISPEIRKVLENVEEFEVKAIFEKVREVKNGLKTDRTENVKRLNDKNLMHRLTKAIFYDVATSQGGAACYTPRHNLYAKIGKEWVNFEICYECSNLRGKFSGEDFYTSINDKFSKKIFDQILQNAESNK
jgi:hypothetical protein